MGWVLLMPAAERNLGHAALCVSRCHGRQDLGAAIFAQAITGRGLGPQKENKNKNKTKLTKSWFSLLGLFYVALDNDYPMSKESCR